jgi:hypothetical protein
MRSVSEQLTDSSVWVRQSGREVVTLVNRSNSTERYDKRAVIGREGIISDANEDDNFDVQGKGILARIQGKRGGG